MADRQAKYCLDMNHIRWSLVEGIITRKNPQDGPTEGQELSIEQVTGIEKTSVKRVHRSRLAWPVTLFAAALLALSAWMASISWLAALPGFLVGVLALIWGATRIPARAETLEAHRLKAAVANPEDWTVVGSLPDVQGFLQGVRIELQEKERQAQQSAHSQKS